METQHLSLQTRFVQNTLVTQNDVSNNIEWQLVLSSWVHEKYWLSMYIYVHIHSCSGRRVWCCHIKHNVMHDWLLYQTEGWYYRPHWKSLMLTFEQFQNLRPISNLKVVSKLVEKVVATQLTDHVMKHHLDETFQSAYKNSHSTETALVRVQNDILCAIDNNESAILLLLDSSAALDTVDHSLLLSRLLDRFGVNGTAVDGLSHTWRRARSLFWARSFISPIHHPLLILSSSTSYSTIYTLMIPSCIYLLELTVAMISLWLSVVSNAV